MSLYLHRVNAFDRQLHAVISCASTPAWLQLLSHMRADAAAEKNTRAAFKAEVDRRLSRKTVVILDTLNNIKGFRCAGEPGACNSMQTMQTVLTSANAT